MTRSVGADPVIGGIARGNQSSLAADTILLILSSLLVHSWSAFGAMKGDICSALKYLLKTRLFYFCIILIMLVATPSGSHTNGSVISYRDIYIHDINATAQVMDRNLCWFRTGPFDKGIVNHLNTNIFPVSPQKGPVTYSHNIGSEVQQKEMECQFFLSQDSIGEQPVTCTSGTISPSANVVTVPTSYFVLFLRNLWIISTIFFNAPWFHFCIMLDLVFRLFSTSAISEHTPSRFQLLVRLRMAIGMRQVQRLSYVGLLRLKKSHAPMHSLEVICGFPRSRSLSEQANMASLEDLTYLYSASDIISAYVCQLVSQRQPADNFRVRTQGSRTTSTDVPKCELIYHL